MADNDNTVLDLRPEADTIKGHLLRLGLRWEYTDRDETETWADSDKMLRAVFATKSPDSVAFTDLKANTVRTIPAADLATITEIRTSTSDPIGA
ncbi:hypothetical protein [Bifidobacterium biavatii]|uniref:Uncharacterized protein n=1 Tax=Bifidobacterium biavatii DSM 23969 TaxID=1437608 RepID=A0A086ZDU5_9BIFI|nr:hypothetical protein [Bifidobacterium biavatii]KFI44695.1 hypothetical protein BBIA_2551 [Bifidobacterium biavatii DSM 23969]